MLSFPIRSAGGSNDYGRSTWLLQHRIAAHHDRAGMDRRFTPGSSRRHSSVAKAPIEKWRLLSYGAKPGSQPGFAVVSFFAWMRFRTASISLDPFHARASYKGHRQGRSFREAGLRKNWLGNGRGLFLSRSFGFASLRAPEPGQIDSRSPNTKKPACAGCF